MLKRTEYKFCLVVPHFNHHEQFARFYPELRATGLHLILIDDGSNKTNYQAIRQLTENEISVTLISLPSNSGKGAAVAEGIKHAQSCGFSHAIQVDADGQHDLSDLDKFMDKAMAFPHSIVSGLPIFSDDIPRVRLQGRKFTLLWARIETLSAEIQDAMCGFRVYPVELFLNTWGRGLPSRRMQFDIEILVRSSWRGQKIVFIPTRVRYPASGLSHFQMLTDNIELSLMHTRLFFGMLIRLPKLLARRLGNNNNKPCNREQE